MSKFYKKCFVKLKKINKKKYLPCLVYVVIKKKYTYMYEKIKKTHES